MKPPAPIRTDRAASTLSRTPPDPVARALRREVEFACPIANCGRADLEYHHFDPPWAERAHHDVAGMIALCATHHRQADHGSWTRAELTRIKKHRQPREIIHARFPWATRDFIWRLGGSYAARNRGPLLSIGGRPYLWAERSANDRLLLSLDLDYPAGQTVVRVRENSIWLRPPLLWDFRFRAGHSGMRVWLAENCPGLDLRFQRYSLSDLQAQFTRDQILSPDSLVDYCREKLMDEDGMVPLVDIRDARLLTSTRTVRVKDGITTADSPGGIFGCVALDGGGGAFAL